VYATVETHAETPAQDSDGPVVTGTKLVVAVVGGRPVVLGGIFAVVGAGGVTDDWPILLRMLSHLLVGKFI